MSKYTTEVRYICESYAGVEDNVDNIITLSIPKIFDFSFPIFDEGYRSILERKILKHYYTREIGLETVGLWKLKLNTKLNEIMPYYNKLYLSEIMVINPLYTTDIEIRKNKNTNKTNNEKEGKEEEKSGSKTNTEVTTEEGNINTDSSTQDLYSDTPQGSITNLDLTDGGYLTNARLISGNEGVTDNRDITVTNTGSDTVETNSNRVLSGEASTTEEYVERITGYKNKDVNELLIKYRKSLVNIDIMIINELKDLFLMLW